MSYLCKNCGSEVPEDALFCSKCGEKITALRCPSCGKRLPEDSAFCTYCGVKIAVEENLPQPPKEEPQADMRPVVTAANTTDKEEQTKESEAPSLTEPLNIHPSEPSADTSQVVDSESDEEGYQGAEEKKYHLTRRKFTGYVPSLEKTDLVISSTAILISNHNVNFLGSNKPEEKQSIEIADLRAITVGREVSGLWLCLSLFVTISDLLLILAESSGFKITFILLAVVSWLMVWRQKITFYCKDGKKIAIRGREKVAMQEIQQELLSHIEAEPEYTGDLGDIVVKKTQYYLPEFEKAKRNEKCRFNWAAFFFNGIFAYYRKSQEVFWHYYKWPLIIYAVIILGISSSGFVAVKSETGFVGWFVAVAVLSLAINIYLLITNIRFGKNFNREYYQHCTVLAEHSDVTPRTVGTSVKNAILYWVIMSLCAGVISGIAGAMVSAAFFGGISDDPWGDDITFYQEDSDVSEIVGCWELVEVEQEGTAYPFGDSRENGMYYIFHEDNTAELYYFENGESDSAVALWERSEDTIRLAVQGNDETILLVMNGEHLVLTMDGEIARFIKTSSDDRLPDDLKPNAVPQSDITVFDFVGDYTYDASFDDPDGTYTNFCYSLQVLQVIEGVNVSLSWRGNRIFGDIYIGEDTPMDGNTISFYVEDYQTDYEPGYHSLTYLPAEQSPYGADTIYIDGNTDMPYTRDSYSYGSDNLYGSGDGYILPTDTQYITEMDLYGMSKEQVSLARNEIYARYGYSFRSSDIRNYFERQSWYFEDPDVNANTFGIEDMTDCERANLETIQQYERDMGWKS